MQNQLNHRDSIENKAPDPLGRSKSVCQRCGAPIDSRADFPDVCDDCYTLYGSCCNEFESED